MDAQVELAADPLQGALRPLLYARLAPAIAGVVVAAVTISVALGLGHGVNALVGVADTSESPTLTESEPYAFTFLTPGSSVPIGYDHCQPIRIEVNAAQAPTDWRSLVREALAETSSASGFTFDYLGETDDASYDDRAALNAFGRQPDPVLLGWASGTDRPRLRGDVVGYGGSTAARDLAGHRTLTTGAVVLDRDYFASLAKRRGGHAQARAVIEHELGHLLGLDHVQDPDEMMYPVQREQRAFGPGDRAGFARLAALPCG